MDINSADQSHCW